MRGKDSEWKGKRFVLVSLAVTTVSIIFFFALKAILPTIREGAAELREVTQRVIVRGGGKVQSIEVTIASKSEAEAKFFEKLKREVEQGLKRFEGLAFWSVNLDEMRTKVLSSGWAQVVSVRRAFPQKLSVQIIPRKPRFWVKSRNSWALVDGGGVVMSIQTSIEGWLADLPIVTGMTGVFQSPLDMNEMNRQASFERAALVDLSQLVDQLEQKMRVHIESVKVNRDPYFDGHTFAVTWTEKRRMNEEEKERSVTTTFLESQWSDRLSSLQFIMSDLKKENFSDVKILGAYKDRWFVENEGDKNGKAVSNFSRH